MGRFTSVPIKYSQLETLCRRARLHRAEHMRALIRWFFAKVRTRATPAPVERTPPLVQASARLPENRLSPSAIAERQALLEVFGKKDRDAFQSLINKEPYHA